MTQRSPFRYFKTSPDIIRLAMMLYIRFPLSLRNVEDLLHERGIESSHETDCYRSFVTRATDLPRAVRQLSSQGISRDE
jgi:transposase-like protein